MKKYLKALVNLICALAVLLLIVWLVPRLLVFFSPFVAGWIIALLAGPPVQLFESKLKIKRKTGSAVVIVLVIGLVVLLLYFVSHKLVEEIVDLVNALPDMWVGLEDDLTEISRRLNVLYAKLPSDIQEKLSNIGTDFLSYMGEFVGGIGSPTIVAVGNFAKQLPSVLIGVIMGLLSAYFFVAERTSIGGWFRSHMPAFIQTRYQMIKHSMIRAVGGYLKAQLKIEVWMYLLLVIGLSILRVDYVLLIALLIAFLDLLPFFGTGTVMVPWAIIKILSADYQMAVGLLIIWGVGQLARQLIQPKIMGDSIGFHPIPTLFLLYIGYKLGGVFGMIAAVPIGLIVFSLYEEGAFDTTRNSILILVNGINRFRKLEKEDLEELRASDGHSGAASRPPTSAD